MHSHERLLVTVVVVIVVVEGLVQGSAMHK